MTHPTGELIVNLQPLRLDVKKTLSVTSDRVKSVDIHPSEPWVLAALYSGHLFIWNYTNSTLVKSIEVCELPGTCDASLYQRVCPRARLCATSHCALFLSSLLFLMACGWQLFHCNMQCVPPSLSHANNGHLPDPMCVDGQHVVFLFV
jgi:hypothetical protein